MIDIRSKWAVEQYASEKIELHNSVINNTSTEKVVGIMSMGYIKAMEDLLKHIQEDSQ